MSTSFKLDFSSLKNMDLRIRLDFWKEEEGQKKLVLIYSLTVKEM